MDGFVKSGFLQNVTLKNIRIVISSGSEKSLTKQDSSSLLLLGMTESQASGILIYFQVA